LVLAAAVVSSRTWGRQLGPHSGARRADVPADCRWLFGA